MSSRPGPVPKRSEERRRRNTPAAGEPTKLDIEAVPEDEPGSLPFLIKQPIVVPEPVVDYEHDDADDQDRPRAGWHPIALELWESLKRSGQAVYWEPSDWMVAKLMCESISRDLKPQFVGVTAASEQAASEPIYERIPLKGASLGAYLKAFGQLGLTEGERRRMALEISSPRESDAKRPPAKVVPFKQSRGDQLRGATS